MSLSQIVANLSDHQKFVLAAQKNVVDSYGDALENWPEEVILATLCEAFKIPFVKLGLEMVDTDAFQRVKGQALEFRFLPLYTSDLLWIIATAEPWNEMYLRDLRRSLEKEIRLVGITETDFDRTIALLTSTEGVTLEPPPAPVQKKYEDKPFESWNVHEESYRELIRDMFERAYQMQVSDIILDPMEDRLCVRFRVHGTLEMMPPIELKHMNGVIMEIKLLSHIPTGDVSHFKSGRASLTLSDGTPLDLRCEIQPTHHGESAILRLLDPGFMKKFSGSLPFTGEQYRVAEYCLNRTKGLILVTGPTGSGKTTTLYSCLTSIDYRSKNVRTLENPVEYAIDGIVQSQVGGDADSPVTFLDGLRSHMRADPDVILVGEIRDENTALAAMRAALTGHLVLSTLHTNDAIDSLNRIMDLGVSPYLVKSTLLLVIAQRLVPKLCPHCRQSIATPEKVAKHFQYYGEPVPEKIWVKGGCPLCFHTGISGRLPIFEFFFPSEKTRDLIKPNFLESELRKAWRAEGGRNLVHGALHLIANGTVTYEDLEVHETEYVSH
jgi:type II secretory ATPase GspE/PulE/Tfp pilus assembly ATPase PilB-like protein